MIKAGDHCNYQGWWYKTGELWVDITIMNRECNVGVYSYINDSVDPRCFDNSYTLSKVKKWKLKPYNHYENGMYEAAPMNSCQDYPAFNQRDAVFRSFMDSVKGSKKKSDEAEKKSKETADKAEAAAAGAKHALSLALSHKTTQ